MSFRSKILIDFYERACNLSITVQSFQHFTCNEVLAGIDLGEAGNVKENVGEDDEGV